MQQCAAFRTIGELWMALKEQVNLREEASRDQARSKVSVEVFVVTSREAAELRAVSDCDDNGRR
jgi:plasmid maintenance system antidote protein VapI